MPSEPVAVDKELVELFQSIGLSSSKARDVARSPKHCAALKELIDSNSLAGKTLDDKRATLVSAFAVQAGKLGLEERSYVVAAILDERLRTTEQLSAATKYFEVHSVPLDDAQFNVECGVGFSITADDLYSSVVAYVSSNAVSGWTNLGTVVSALKNTPALRWANPLDVKNTVDRVFTERFGAKGAKAPPKEAKKLDATLESTSTPVPVPSTRSVFEEGFLGNLHKPGGNPQIHPHLREAHLAATAGMVYTRFPPEPNGYLHIGHSKAIFVNFGYAAHYGGRCYLRYDDTNPKAEEGRYFESILEIVRWLGYEPYRITYSSDHFDKLYELAVELIRRDKAYICHCTAEEIKADRGEKVSMPKACGHRGRPVSESLTIFEDMKNGKYSPGEAILRMKQNLEDGNPQMWDLVAYRVLHEPHHRTGSKWCIYPTYDFTHCLCDSFENISHSLCTVEFILSRVSYEWLCDALEVYKPRQSEYGRLNLEGTIMSKRKLLRLVKEGHVRDWDDPRLYTLVALRRRGVPPEAIISFVSGLGVSTSPSNIQIARFDHAVRQYLENSVPRLLMVLRPLKVTIENLAEDYVLMVEKPLHPKVPELGTSTIPFTRHIYIEADDFRLQDSKDYFRLAPGKTVDLFQAPYPITCTSYTTDPATGDVVELTCRLETGAAGLPAKKPKAYIQWVAIHEPSGSPVRFDETRIFNRLFKSDNPAATPDFVEDLNPDSLEVVRGALGEVGFWTLAKRAYEETRRASKARTEKARADSGAVPPAPSMPGTHDDTPRATSEQLVGNECVRFQGLRVAYFALDKDARVSCLSETDTAAPGRRTGDYLVLNRIVSLKEDAGKTAT